VAKQYKESLLVKIKIKIMKKKIFAGILALSFCFVALGAVQVQGAESDIRKDMAALEVMLKNIQEQITKQTTETSVVGKITGIPAGYTFARDLRIGSSGDVVRYLQILLNADPDTRLTGVGAGSPGMETEYFGALTDAAVRKFQSKYAAEVLAPVGLTSPTGFVGTQTRAKLNAILAKGVTGVPEKPVADSAILEAIKEIADAVKKLQARVDALYKDGGEEGSLSVELRADIRNAEVAANQTSEVAVFRMKAEDSDINLQRFDLYFNHGGTNSSTATEFRRYISRVALYHGDNKLQEITLSTSNPARDDKYIRFSNVNLNIPKGEYRDITVRVTGTSRDETKILEIGPTDSMALRATDGAGVTQYAGGSNIRRTFTFVGEKKGILEVRRHADSPKEKVVEISETKTTEVELLRFTFTAKDNDIELEKLTALITAGDTTVALDDIVQDAVLYEGTKSLDVATVNATSGKATFDKLEITIKKGETKTFTIKVNVLKTAVENQGASLLVTLVKSDNLEIGYDVNDKEVGLDKTIAGYKQHLYVVFPEIIFHASSIERIQILEGSNDRATGSIDFSVKAHGGKIYFEKDENVKNDSDGAVDFDGFALNFAGLTSNATKEGDYYYILEGVTRKIEVDFETQNVAERNRVAVKELRWFVEKKNGDLVEFNWTGDFVEELKTDRISLYWTL
jgi:hypothetical protein